MYLPIQAFRRCNPALHSFHRLIPSKISRYSGKNMRLTGPKQPHVFRAGLHCLQNFIYSSGSLHLRNRRQKMHQHPFPSGIPEKSHNFAHNIHRTDNEHKNNSQRYSAGGNQPPSRRRKDRHHADKRKQHAALHHRRERPGDAGSARETENRRHRPGRDGSRALCAPPAYQNGKQHRHPDGRREPARHRTMPGNCRFGKSGPHHQRKRETGGLHHPDRTQKMEGMDGIAPAAAHSPRHLPQASLRVFSLTHKKSNILEQKELI